MYFLNLVKRKLKRHVKSFVELKWCQTITLFIDQQADSKPSRSKICFIHTACPNFASRRSGRNPSKAEIFIRVWYLKNIGICKTELNCQ